MTTYDALGLPIFETTDKIAADGDGIREDLNLIGASARTAILAAKWDRGEISANTDLNTLTAPGAYAIPTYAVANSLVNRPSAFPLAIDRATLEVLYVPNGAAVVQRWSAIKLSTFEAPVVQRRKDDGGTWSAWVRTDDIAPSTQAALAWVKRALNTAEDLNSLTVAGIYNANSYAVANSIVNRPTAFPFAIDRATVEVIPTSGTVLQRWSTTRAAADDNPVVQRRRDSGGTWSAWIRTDASTGSRGIASGEDLNSLTVAGVYPVNSYAIANSLVNRPTSYPLAIDRAVIEVLTATGTVAQRWTTTRNAAEDAPVLLRRRDSAGTWSAWVRTDKDDAAAIASIAVDWSHQTHRGMLRAMLGEASQATPVWGWTAPAGARLTLPTHEGSGQGTHPSVLNFPSGWNGYKYWMAFTPYPNGNEAHEDPNIIASNDGTTWVVPAGLTNPLDDQTGTPNAYNSDTHLTMGPNGEMILTWRMVDRPNGNQNIFYWRTSTDGVTWTPKREIFRSAAGANDLSQSLNWVGNKWRMYAIYSGTKELSYYETTAAAPTAADWGARQVCTTTPNTTGDRSWWHVDVQQHNGAWVGIVNDQKLGNPAMLYGDILFMRSTDGITWDVSTVPLLPRLSATHDAIYKSSFVPSGSGASLTLDVFYSGYTMATQDFRIYRTTAKLASV